MTGARVSRAGSDVDGGAQGTATGWPPGPLLFRLSSPSSGFGNVTKNVDLILSPFEAKRRGLHQDNGLQSLPEAPASAGRGVDPAPHVPSAPGT